MSLIYQIQKIYDMPVVLKFVHGHFKSPEMFGMYLFKF